MKFYIIRHGQTNWNKEGRIQGKTDIELNEEGILEDLNLHNCEIRTFGIYYNYYQIWFMVLGELTLLLVGIYAVFKNDIYMKKKKILANEG